MSHDWLTDFGTEEIIARRDAGRDLEIDKALVGDQLIHCPRGLVGFETIFVDLEPFQTRDIGLQRRVDPSRNLVSIPSHKAKNWS